MDNSRLVQLLGRVATNWLQLHGLQLVRLQTNRALKDVVGMRWEKVRARRLHVQNALSLIVFELTGVAFEMIPTPDPRTNLPTVNRGMLPTKINWRIVPRQTKADAARKAPFLPVAWPMKPAASDPTSSPACTMEANRDWSAEEIAYSPFALRVPKSVTFRERMRERRRGRGERGERRKSETGGLFNHRSAAGSRGSYKHSPKGVLCRLGLSHLRGSVALPEFQQSKFWKADKRRRGASKVSRRSQAGKRRSCQHRQSLYESQSKRSRKLTHHNHKE